LVKRQEEGMPSGAWSELDEELSRWKEADKVATFWWRDDDAAEPGEALDRLLEVAGELPISLAVIPAEVAPDLAYRLAAPQISILQHGWRHANHATGASLSEFPNKRTEHDVRVELAAGRKILLNLFVARALPVFVPPWHAFDDRFLPLLAETGIKSISRKGPRATAYVSGIFHSNIHAVPINWTDPPSFNGEEAVLCEIVEHLRGRRTGECDEAEPTGILTHHLVQDAESYEFLHKFIRVLSSNPNAVWLSARDIFPIASVSSV
jgi:hypothetical protein